MRKEKANSQLWERDLVSYPYTVRIDSYEVSHVLLMAVFDGVLISF